MESKYSSIASDMDVFEFSFSQNEYIAKYIMISSNYHPEFEEIMNMSYNEFIHKLQNNSLPDFPRNKKPKFHREMPGVFFSKSEWLYLNRHRLEYMLTNEFVSSGNHIDILFGYTKPINREKYLALFESLIKQMKK
jgi:hypothetical protein